MVATCTKGEEIRRNTHIREVFPEKSGSLAYLLINVMLAKVAGHMRTRTPDVFRTLYWAFILSLRPLCSALRLKQTDEYGVT